MGRLIGAFACALVANADYICTSEFSLANSSGEFASDCQCLTNVEHNITGVRTIWSLPPGEEGQGNFTVGYTAHTPLRYRFPDGQELCLAYSEDSSFNMQPCDDVGDDYFLLITNARQLLHMNEDFDPVHPVACIEPNLVQGHGELLSIGLCSARWKVSSTPICSHESELVIA